MADQTMLTPLPAPKCCCCSVDIACYIYAILSMIQWGMILVIIGFFFLAEPSFLAFIIFLVCLVGFMFSFLLFYGTQKRRSDLLRIYLMYAVAMKAVTVLGIIIYCLYTVEIVHGLVALGSSCLGFYLIAYLLVKRTYDHFLAEESRITGLLLVPQSVPKAYNSMEPSAAGEP